MSVMTPTGYGRADVATFSAQFPRAGMAQVSSSQVQGIAQPTPAVTASAGNPTFPWVGLILALVLLRVATHLRRE